METQSTLLPRLRFGLLSCQVALNAILAGGIYVFPILAPAIASHLKLTQPQLTSIVLAGMIGQYPFAAVVGKIIDRHGPWACSLGAAILFSFGFGLFALEISTHQDTSSDSFRRLTFFFLLCGLGTVFSYFSSLFAASKAFPAHPGFASGFSMCIFGLSPLFLSLLASTFFTDAQSGLDVTRFLAFLAVITGIVYVLGALIFRLLPPNTSHPTPTETEPISSSASEDDLERLRSDDERDPLLHDQRAVNADEPYFSKPVVQDGSTLDLIKDPDFWLLAVFSLLILGVCEMVISNIGTIVLSLKSSRSSATDDVATSTQVRVLSVANTVSRLLSGPLADFTSPVVSYLPSGSMATPSKHLISRVAFLSGASLILIVSFSLLELVIRSREGLWVLSIGVGTAYGTVFTVLPSILSAIWGSANVGRNFGLISYAPFFGTTAFSYLYAFVSAYYKAQQGHEGDVEGGHEGGDGVCVGVVCWRLTFWICVGAALVSFAQSVVLWRRWKGRV